MIKLNEIESVSIDMSTEESPYNRIYAKPIEKQGDVLLCEFESANYDINKKGKDFTTGISEEMYLDQLKVKENMIKSYQEENTKLKENIHSMLFTDDVVQDRYDKAKRENEKLKELLQKCRQKMFAAEKNYGFDDSIIDILTPMMDEIDQVLGEE